jgi:hypothetical protein
MKWDREMVTQRFLHSVERERDDTLSRMIIYVVRLICHKQGRKGEGRKAWDKNPVRT